MKTYLRTLKLVIITILFFPSFVNAGLRNNEDRDIAKSYLKKFINECSYVVNIEKNIVEKLEKNYEKLRKVQDSKEYECYTQQLSRITSVHFIYRKLCDDLTDNGSPNEDNGLMKSLVSVEKFRQGISLHHSLLNDCLRQVSSSGENIVPLSNSMREASYLTKALQDAITVKPVLENRLDFR